MRRHGRESCAGRYVATSATRAIASASSPRTAWDRWVVERTLSWLNRFRRLKIRYEHRADIHLAFLQPGCALISLRFLGLTTSNPRERSAWAHGLCYT